MTALEKSTNRSNLPTASQIIIIIAKLWKLGGFKVRKEVGIMESGRIPTETEMPLD